MSPFEIEDTIVDILKTEVPTAVVGVCTDPEGYVDSNNPSKFPLILVKYESDEPYEEQYPGLITLNVFFVTYNKRSLQLALDVTIDKVFKKLHRNNLGLGANRLTLIKKGYYSESKDHIIYNQQYQLFYITK